jgi:hypothetical protein
MKSRVKYIKRIQIIRDTSEPGLLAIRAEGIADLGLALNPVLLPKRLDSEPEDGIFELDFKIDESTQEYTDVEMEVQVIIRLRNMPAWVKGIRINADENSDIELI